MNQFEMIQGKNHKRQGIRTLLGILGAILLLCVILGICWLNQFHVSILLNGSQEITMEYGDPYVEPGASAMISGRFILKNGRAVPVSTSGNVNPTGLGEYEIDYSAGIWNLRQTKTRRVKVVDSVPPKIRLNGSEKTFVLPGSTYEEEGFLATDNHDGNISDNVVCTVGKDSIEYCVADQSGNCTKIIRTLEYGDQTPPVINLNGADLISILIGEDYIEPGYEAHDNYDGEITDQVVTDGIIDSFSPGSYKLRYFVRDSYGNTSETFRTVEVKAASPVQIVEPSGKVVYLTFDDGPSCYTEDLLEVLDRYNAKATFFVVNTAYSDVIGEIKARGHSVGVHSASHVYREIYASEEAFVDDLKRMQGVIEEKTGEKTYLMRFPGGSSNTVSAFNPGIMSRLTELVSEMGFQYFDWNVDSGDASGAKTSAEVAQNVISAVKGKKISIVLQHDSRGFSVDAVEKILAWGQENGYKFMALSPDSPCAHHGVNN